MGGFVDAAYSGVIYQSVDSSKGFIDLCKYLFNTTFFGNVQIPIAGGATGLVDFIRQLLAGRILHIGNGYLRTFLG
jgi:hypothetical protein